MSGKVLDGPVTIRGDLIVTGRLNKGLDTVQSNNGKALQVIQGVLQPVVTQPNTVPQSGDVRMYGQNVTINGNVVPGGTDGYFQIDEYINGAWQHLFEIQPSTTGNANVLDLFISGRLFARDSVLSAPGRFFFKPSASPFGSSAVVALAYGNGVFVAISSSASRSTDGGETWGSLITLPTGTYTSLTYGNGLFVAVGYTTSVSSRDAFITKSADYGATWSAAISVPLSGPPPTVDPIGLAIAYGNGVFVVACSSPVSVGALSRSTDNGATWSAPITTGIGAGAFVSRGTYGNGVFVFAFSDGNIARSDDNGITWTTPSTPSAWCIAYGNGVFIIGGYAGSMAKSIDNGITWTNITGPFGSDSIANLYFSSGVFLALTNSGKASRSLDLGVTWGVTYGSNDVVTVMSTYAIDVAADNKGRFVIVGYDFSNIPIAYTDYVEAGAGIVESGSNSNGSYVKYADGMMECWGTLGRTSTAELLATPIYVSPGYIGWAFPAAFSAIPFVEFIATQDSNSYCWGGSAQNTTLTQSGAFMFSCSVAASTIPTCHAIGYWR